MGRSNQTNSLSRREWTEATRERIDSTKIVERFGDHFAGDVELSASQIKVGEILLRKTLPDLSATDLTSKGDSISFDFTVKRK